jgi:alkanesulfonate monooxygenase SsuD/methylene tetrahydromethanopterin reductase-like flavin-dependent oxidoreductase (luciferase family)
MRFGAMTLPNVSWAELEGRWRTLDELGFDSIWVADHLVSPIRPEQPWLDGWTCLVGMAHATSRARIGTLVSPLTFRRPAVLAKAAVTVDHACGGRLELGVGAGDSARDRELAEVAQPTSHDAFVRLRALLDDVSLAPRPVQGRIPLTIGGASGALLRTAALLADRWNVHIGIGPSPDEGLRRARDRNQALDRACADAGRTEKILRSAHLGYRFVGDEPWQSANAFAAYAARWREAGFDELILFYPPHVGVRAPAAERVLADVLPTLRDA